MLELTAGVACTDCRRRSRRDDGELKPVQVALLAHIASVRQLGVGPARAITDTASLRGRASPRTDRRDARDRPVRRRLSGLSGSVVGLPIAIVSAISVTCCAARTHISILPEKTVMRRSLTRRPPLLLVQRCAGGEGEPRGGAPRTAPMTAEDAAVWVNCRLPPSRA